MEIVKWAEVPEKVRNLLERDEGYVPEYAVVTDNPKEIVSTELYVLSFIFEKPYRVYRWVDENTVSSFSTGYCISIKNRCKLIKDGDLERFLKVALPLSHDAEIQRILSYYYEIMFRTSSVQVKIITLVSLLEYIVSSPPFDKENVISKDWIKNATDSFVEETIRTGYFKRVKEAKQSGKYGLFCSSLGNINEKSMKNKILAVCAECGLKVDMKILNDIYKARNGWIHGRSADDVNLMVEAYPPLGLIVQMMIVYKMTGRYKNYQSFMNPFKDINGIVEWDRFFEH